MRYVSRVLFMLLTLLAAAPVAAQTLVTEVIPLGYRTLEEIIPAIQPLVPPPGSVTGMNNQLVVRTTPDNLQAIKDVLSKDMRLYLAETTGSYQKKDVRVTADESVRPGRGLNVSVEGDDNRRLNGRVFSNRSQDNEVGMQRIQTVEGREAFIQTGRSVPVADQYYGGWRGRGGSVRYKDVNTGFLVLPRITGDRVTLEINPQRARESRRDGGKFDIQGANTVVSARLGEWVMVGGSEEDPTASGRGTVFSTRRDSNVNNVILLRVTELPR